MSLGDSMKKIIGIDDVEDDEITEEEIEAEKERLMRQNSSKKTVPPAPSAERHSTVGTKPSERNFANTDPGAFKLVLIEPKTFEECPKLVNSLKSRRPVIINLESLDVQLAKKIFDFLSGATYALNGTVQKVANNIFIFAPENVDIAGGQLKDKSGLEFTMDSKKPASAPKKTVKVDDGNMWRK